MYITKSSGLVSAVWYPLDSRRSASKFETRFLGKYLGQKIDEHPYLAGEKPAPAPYRAEGKLWARVVLQHIAHRAGGDLRRTQPAQCVGQTHIHYDRGADLFDIVAVIFA